ncbi:hypothetical protein D9M68_488380 [compost metagenome]
MRISSALRDKVFCRLRNTFLTNCMEMVLPPRLNRFSLKFTAIDLRMDSSTKPRCLKKEGSSEVRMAFLKLKETSAKGVKLGLDGPMTMFRMGLPYS